MYPCTGITMQKMIQSLGVLLLFLSCAIASLEPHPQLFDCEPVRSFLQLRQHECRSLSKETPDFQLRVRGVTDTTDSRISDCKLGWRQYDIILYSTNTGHKLLGFLIQVKSSDSNGHLSGNFVGPSEDWIAATCQTANDSAVHMTHTTPKDSVTVTWRAPCSDTHIQLLYYVIDSSGCMRGPSQTELMLHKTKKWHTNTILKRETNSNECNVTGDLRLVGGSSLYEGRVEICWNGTWGTICNYNNDWYYSNAANVVCQQLGYPYSAATPRVGNDYGNMRSSGPIVWSDVYCYGDAENLLECSYSTTVYYELCDHTKDVGVQCQGCAEGSLQLVNSNNPSNGLLEVCLNQTVGTVCGLTWGEMETVVACRELGYDSGEAYHFGYGSGQLEVYNIECDGSEANLNECTITRVTGICSHSYDIQLRCYDIEGCSEGEVRLTHGRSAAEGRVEVCINDIWHSVCENNFYSREAQVVCAQLGFSRKNAERLSSSYFGNAQRPIISFDCTGTEVALQDCSNYTDSYYCYGDVGLKCEQVCSVLSCEDGAVRLVNSDEEYEGTLEICFHNTWTRICSSSYFDSAAAQVVCNQLGHPSIGASALEVQRSDSSDVETVVIDIFCTRDNSNIMQCTTAGSLSTCYSNDVAVRCQDAVPDCTDGDIRLIGGQSELEGTLEVCLNGTWGSVCDYYWGYEETRVVCQQLGYTATGSSYFYSGYFGQSLSTVHINNVQCSGSESSLLECGHSQTSYYSCSHTEDVGVRCLNFTNTDCVNNGEIRLIGGQTAQEGTVEICINGIWGSVCGNIWGYEEAEVVCRELGYSSLGATYCSYGCYGQSFAPIFVSNVQCTGFESSLLECAHEQEVHSGCSSFEDVGIRCSALQPEGCETGDVQLVGGGIPTRGTVALCYNNTWGTVCADTWDSLDAAVVCKQLGYSPFGVHSTSQYYSPYTRRPTSITMYLGSVHCNGSESSLLDCNHTQSSFSDGYCEGGNFGDVVCQETISTDTTLCEHGAVRLVDGNSFDEGRVEVCFEDHWATICDHQWNEEDAEVVCRQLGHSGGLLATFDSGDGPILFYHYDCTGDEQSLTDCTRLPLLSSCSHDTDAGVRCTENGESCTGGDIRLVNGQSEMEGAVEVCFNGVWGAVCDNNWGRHEAEVTCRQLGFSTEIGIPRQNGFYGNSPAPLVLDNVVCSGNESSILDCQHDGLGNASCNYRNDAGVQCLGPCLNGTVRLVQKASARQGGVEICINNLWHTALVNDNLNNLQEASVICSQLGFSPVGVEILTGNQQVTNPLHINRAISCKGTESSLSECRSQFSIDCYWDDYIDNYFDYFDYYDYYNYYYNYYNYYYYYYYYQFSYYGCHSYDDYLYSNYRKLYIQCQEFNSSCDSGQVRLVGGQVEYEGRVEICRNGTWVTICDPSWNDADAQVVCRQLGHPTTGATATFSGYTSTVNVPTTTLHFSCTGTESNLLDCTSYASTLVSYNYYSYYYYYYYYYYNYFISYSSDELCTSYWRQNAGVQCNANVPTPVCTHGDVRLAGNSNSSQEGIVQVCYNGSWVYICDDYQNYWVEREASVICQQLGYPRYGAQDYYTYLIGVYQQNVFPGTLQCSGMEASLLECENNVESGNADCFADAFLSVRCATRDPGCEDGMVRLIGGETQFEGRVEICFDGVWGTVCSDNWGSRDAAVVCRQLGILQGTPNVYFGGGGPVLLDELCCVGTESSLLECSHAGVGIHRCTTNNAAAVLCADGCTFFTQEPQDEIAIQNGIAQFTCSYDCMNPYYITWIYESPSGSSILIANASQVAANSTKYSLSNLTDTLVVHDVTYADRGIFTCTATSDLVVLTSSAVLTVKVPPVVQVAGNVSVVELETLVLYCNATGYPAPSISWVKRIETGTNVLNSLRITTAISESIPPLGSNDLAIVTSTLTIINVITEDSGDYVCEANNGDSAGLFGISSLFVNVSAKNECRVSDTGATPCQNGGVCIDAFGGFLCQCVGSYMGPNCEQQIQVPDPETPPDIVNPPNNETVGLHEALNLTCEATGNPPPSYQWYQDGEAIPGANLPFLFIPEASPENRGFYTCVATNENGNASSNPGLAIIPDVYQYAVSLEIVNITERAAVMELIQEVLMITGNTLESTTALVLSVRILIEDIESSDGQVMPGSSITFVVTVETQTTEGLINDIVSAIPSALTFYRVTDIKRHDGCPSEEASLIPGGAITYSWAESEIGTTLTQPCPCRDLIDLPGGTAMVIRHCGGTYTHGAEWREVDFSQCGLSVIAIQLCEATLLESEIEVAATVANITENTDQLEVSAVSVASTIVEDLTTAAINQPQVRGNYLATIDNLIEVDTDIILESQLETQASTRLLESLGRFTDLVPISTNTNSTDNREIYALDNFAVQVQDIDRDNFFGETFSVDLGTVQQATNTSEQIDQTRLITMMDALMNATASLRLPSSIFDSNSRLSQIGEPKQRLSYGLFLSDALFQTDEIASGRFVVGSIILTLKLNHSGEYNTDQQMEDGIIITFQKAECFSLACFLSNIQTSEETSGTVCANFDPNGNGGFGSWSSDDCYVVYDRDDQAQCECSQPAHFGLLFDLNPGEAVSPLALEVITYIGTVLSVICLIIVIITYSTSTKLRATTHGKLLINLSSALLGLYITFLIAGHVTSVPPLCGIIAALIHYFMLVFFGWTAAEAIYLYRKLVIVLGKNIQHYTFKSGLIIWLVSLLIVIISVAAGHRYYANPFFCRATEYPFWIGLILPFVIIFLFDWIVFIIIMGSLIKQARDRTKKLSNGQGQLKRHLVIAFGLSTIFGLGWGFGLAATGSSAKEVTFGFQLLFSIFVGLQGVLIFILHGLRSQDARDLWKSCFSKASFKSIMSYSITDRPSTIRSQPGKQRFSVQLSTLTSVGTTSSKKQVEATTSTQSFRDNHVGAEEAMVIENSGKLSYEPSPEAEQEPLN